MYALEPAWRERLALPALGLAPLALGEGLDADAWAANEFAGAPLGDARLSARLVESAHHMAQSPMRAITGATNGARALVKGHYRLIDQPADSEVSVEHILAPHRERTLQRMGSEVHGAVRSGHHHLELHPARPNTGAGRDWLEPDRGAGPRPAPAHDACGQSRRRGAGGAAGRVRRAGAPATR